MGIVKTIAEGGQTLAHRIRMFRQVIKLGLITSILSSLISLYILLSQVDKHDMIAFFYHILGKSLKGIKKSIIISSDSWYSISKQSIFKDEIEIPIDRLVAYTNTRYNEVLEYFQSALNHSASIFFLAMIVVISVFLIFGSILRRRQHINGKKVVSPRSLAWKLKFSRKASKIKIKNVPLVKGTETQHIMITGGTGSGKTNCLHHILKQIRSNGQKTVIVDTTGMFVKKYYRDGKDFILNPTHQKGEKWHPWAECENRVDYDELAECFIPQTNLDSENYWRQSAKSFYSALIEKLAYSKKTSDLTRWVLYEPLQNLAGFLEGTRAAAHIDLSTERTAGSVRSVACSYLECLNYLEDTTTPFSIKKWIQQEDDSWLFISCLPSQRAALKPLMTTWISIAFRSLLQMKYDLSRRIWFVIDELPTLDKIKDLETLLTEGRKYGGCGLISLQSPSQLESIYGHDKAKTIMGNCATKIVFAENDPEIAARISKIFGDREIKEFQEGISYGANEIRDGVNLSLHTRNIPTVSSSEIQSLPSNQAFLKLPGYYPITKVKLKISQN